MEELSDERKQKLWDAIIKGYINRTDLLPHERTKKMLMEEYDLTLSKVDILIKRLRRQGLVESRETIVEGKRCCAYTILEK
jgi:DNA-binding FadR family transcriptional regulator